MVDLKAFVVAVILVRLYSKIRLHAALGMTDSATSANGQSITGKQRH